MAGEFVATIDTSEWKQFIHAMEGKLKNPNSMLTAAYSTAGHADIVRHFKDETGSDGSWRQRSWATQIHDALVYKGKVEPAPGTRRAWYQPDRPILTFSGKMRQALLVGKKDVRELGRGVVQAFNRMEYSGKHDRGEEGLPKRDFMWLSNYAHELMAKTLLHLLTDGK